MFSVFSPNKLIWDELTFSWYFDPYLKVLSKNVIPSTSGLKYWARWTWSKESNPPAKIKFSNLVQFYMGIINIILNTSTVWFKYLILIKIFLLYVVLECLKKVKLSKEIWVKPMWATEKHRKLYEHIAKYRKYYDVICFLYVFICFLI